MNVCIASARVNLGTSKIDCYKRFLSHCNTPTDDSRKRSKGWLEFKDSTDLDLCHRFQDMFRGLCGILYVNYNNFFVGKWYIKHKHGSEHMGMQVLAWHLLKNFFEMETMSSSAHDQAWSSCSLPTCVSQCKLHDLSLCVMVLHAPNYYTITY